MGYSCAVYGCLSTIRDKNRSFHRFPKDETRCKRWVKACSRVDLEKKKVEDLVRSNIICDLHFETFNYTGTRLKCNAIPTLMLPIHQADGLLTKSTQTDFSACMEIQSGDNIKTESSTANTSKDTQTTALYPQNFEKIKTIAEQSSSKENQREPKAETSSINSDESTDHLNFEDEESHPNVESINAKALEVTLERIRANPQLYIGIPKNCYHLIDMIHKQTEIPTTHILLCLKKIKLDTHIEELADQFGITADEASDIFTSNVPALANVLHSFVDNQELQIPFRSEPSTCVLDSLEINVQPSSGNSRELTQTERGNTVKYVVCCTPDGYINYVSPGYGGRQSDDTLLEDTKYLDRLKSGDSVMPNGLKNVESMLLQKGLNPVKPRARHKHTTSLRATQHSTNNDSQLSEDHVKRLVGRIREFTMVRDRSILSCDLVRVLDEAVVISCALINLQSFVIN